MKDHSNGIIDFFIGSFGDQRIGTADYAATGDWSPQQAARTASAILIGIHLCRRFRHAATGYEIDFRTPSTATYACISATVCQMILSDYPQSRRIKNTLIRPVPRGFTGALAVLNLFSFHLALFTYLRRSNVPN